MSDSNREIDMGFTTDRYPPGIHMCLIYNNEAERQSIISRFLKAGLLDGEKVGFIEDDMPGEGAPDWFGATGEDVSDDDFEQFALFRTDEIYYPQGKFVPDDTLELLCDFYEKSVEEGYQGARITGNAGFTRSGVPGSEDFMAYESGVNRLRRTHPITALCQYDANRFDGAALYKVLQAHPMMIVNSQIVRNPNYVPPKDLSDNPR